MDELDRLSRRLQGTDAEKALNKAAASAEGQRLLRGLDTKAIEKAAREGDMRALKNIVSGVLATAEGQALAKKLKQSME